MSDSATMLAEGTPEAEGTGEPSAEGVLIRNSWVIYPGDVVGYESRDNGIMLYTKGANYLLTAEEVAQLGIESGLPDPD